MCGCAWGHFLLCVFLNYIQGEMDQCEWAFTASTHAVTVKVHCRSDTGHFLLTLHSDNHSEEAQTSRLVQWEPIHQQSTGQVWVFAGKYRFTRTKSSTLVVLLVCVSRRLKMTDQQLVFMCHSIAFSHLRIVPQAWWRWRSCCESPPQPGPCFPWPSGRSRLWHIL